MNQASLLERVRLGAECRKVLMLVVCFVLNEIKLTSNGLILWLVWKDSKPKSAKMSGIGALVGVGISVLWWLVGMSMLGSMMQYGM